MVSIFTAIAIASGSEVIDAGRIRGGSCANGQCQVAEVVAQPAKAEAKVQQAASCASSSCASQGERKLFGRLRGRCR